MSISISQMEEREALSIILGNQTLRERFSDFIASAELDYLTQEVLYKFNGADWSIGFCSHCYMTITNEYDFLDSVGKNIRSYGATTKLENLYNQCEKLRGTNLFSFKLQQLCDMYFDQEILSIIRSAEDLTYRIYCQDEDEDYSLYLDNFIDSLYNVYVDEDGSIVECRKLPC